MKHAMHIAALFGLLMASAVSAEEPKITYVGDGRYTCSGSSTACALIDAQNRAREAQREAERERQKGK